jgi:hypothetical protein
MLIAQTQEELKAAWAVQANCELESIALIHCKSSRTPFGVVLEEPFQIKGNHKAETANVKGQKLCVQVSFNFGAVDATEVQIFSVESTYELLYSVRETFTPSPSEIDAFKNGNAIFNCWPYFREFFQNITSRMGQTPPVLPLLRVIPKPPSEENLQPKAIAEATRPKNRKRKRA